MNKKKMRQRLAARVIFVGCQFCGETDKTLRNFGDGKICFACLSKRKVSNPDTREGK